MASATSVAIVIFQECLEGWREHGIARFERVLRVTDQMREAILMRLGVVALCIRGAKLVAA
jgi:hypothetical protein